MNSLNVSTSFSAAKAIQTIFTSGFIAGSLDMLAAIIVNSVILHKATDTQILQGIAKGVFGSKALEGGTTMALYGLGLHFLIAFSFTLFYFFIYPRIPFLQKNKIISGLIYGIFVWIVMNIIVLPVLGIANLPAKPLSILRSCIILMLFIGLPISTIVSNYYSEKKDETTSRKE